MGRFAEDDGVKACVIAGRFLSGVSTGIASYIVPLYSKDYTVREVAPFEIYVRLGSINQFMITFGIFLALSLGYICTKYTELYWVFIVPIFVSTIQILLFWKVYTEDTPTYLLNSGKKKEAMDLINTLYFNNEIEEQDSEDMICSVIKTESRISSSRDFFKSLIRSESLKMGCIVSILQQFTGINIYIMNSTQILKNIGNMEAQVGTILIGAVNCISGSLSMFILKSEYKMNLQVGAVWMGLCYIIVIATVSIENFYEIYFACIVMFIIAFEISIGPIMWIYCADVLSDKGVAISTAVNWAGVLLIAGIFMIFNNGFGTHKKSEDYGENIPFVCLNVFYLAFCCLV